MKNLLLFTTLMMVLFLSSCTSYYYAILDSTDRTGAKNMRGDFVMENDTVTILYSFHGENAPVYVTIYNKLEEPLFVDWQRSAVIIEDVSTSYYPGKVPVTSLGEAISHSGAVTNNASYSFSSGYTNIRQEGSFTLPEGVGFIPPKSRIEYIPFSLANFSFDHIPSGEYQTRDFALTNGEIRKIKMKEYTENDSPLYFRSYLSLYTDRNNDNNRQYRTYERSFYISNLIKTGNIPPSNFLAGQERAGDFFYMRKVKGENAGWIIGGIAIGTAGIVIEAALTP